MLYSCRLQREVHALSSRSGFATASFPVNFAPVSLAVPNTANMGVPPGATVVVVDQTMVIQRFGLNPSRCTCPHCRADVITRVERMPSASAWLTCTILFIVGCWPCAPIPFCMESMQTAIHSCPSCGFIIRKVDNFDD
jgi:lipopolysaccharide-induced tumor necrosis factor-alpha factor